MESVKKIMHINPTYYRRTTCRLCGSENLECSFSLTPTPPANSFLTVDMLDLEQRVYPLDVFFCLDCAHLQLLDVVNAGSIFKDYLYVSSTSKVMVEHLKNYADDVIREMSLSKGDFVFEFGSNDGTLLKFFKNKEMKVLGIDPVESLSKLAIDNGVDTIADFFTVESASAIKNKHGHAKVICANNVCAHIDDLQGVIEAVKILLAKDGCFIIEFSYLVDVFEKTLFDTIYHEHLDYHSVIPLKRFLDANGMVLENATRVSTQGGSLRCYVRIADNKNREKRSPEVAKLIKLERSLGLDKPDAFKKLATRIDQRRAELTALISGLKAQGKTIAGYGAPAKATTLMYHFGLDRNAINFTVDDNALKQGLYSPGLQVPIISSKECMEQKPDYIVILAWNFAESIISNNEDYIKSGGRFIVPLPNLEIF